jgi:large repetitive protein
VTLTATATDAAGNVSAAGEISFTLDTTRPAAPALALANDTGTVDDDGITTDAALTITAEAGSTVRVFDGDTELGIATEGAPGQFSFTPAGLADGAVTLTATATDAAGNVSAAGRDQLHAGHGGSGSAGCGARQ